MSTYERRALTRRLSSLVWESDTTPTKVSLVVCAWFLTVGFLSSGDNCQYAACMVVKQVVPWKAWVSVWGVYAVIKSWRVIDGKQRPLAAVLVNVIGAFLYGGIATASTVARWPHWWLSAFEITMACAAWWVLARTTINPGFGFRGD